MHEPQPDTDHADQPNDSAQTARCGTLYLLPNRLADGDWQQVLPAAAVARVAHCRLAFVENAKPARGWLRALFPELELRSVQMHDINPAGQPFDATLLDPVLAGADAMVMSDAGCPGVADPGAAVVRAAHQRGIPVVPLVGPSSILLTLMGSGLQGQRFAFHGYLPVDPAARRQAIQLLAARSSANDETQLMIETPYRNAALWDALLAELSPETLLTAGVDLTSNEQWIRTHSVRQWRQQPPPPFDRRPTVMAFLAPTGFSKQQAPSQKTPAPLNKALASHNKASAGNPKAPAKNKPGAAPLQRKLGKSASR